MYRKLGGGGGVEATKNKNDSEQVSNDDSRRQNFVGLGAISSKWNRKLAQVKQFKLITYENLWNNLENK